MTQGQKRNRCYVMLRNRRTNTTRQCLSPAVERGLCLKHQAVGDYIKRLHDDAMNALTREEEA